MLCYSPLNISGNEHTSFLLKSSWKELSKNGSRIFYFKRACDSLWPSTGMEQHIYLNFRKKRTMSKCSRISSREFLFHMIFSHELLQFSVALNGSLFRNSTNSGYFSSVPDSKFLNECIDKSSLDTSIEIELLIHFRVTFTCRLLGSKEMKLEINKGGSRYSFGGKGTLS